MADEDIKGPPGLGDIKFSAKDLEASLGEINTQTDQLLYQTAELVFLWKRHPNDDSEPLPVGIRSGLIALAENITKLQQSL